MDYLEVKNVRKVYGSKAVVDSISFRAPAGEIMGILGPNGAGKTTIIRMIMGITAPDRGEMLFSLGGREYSHVPKPMVGYLPEERGLYREARVLDVLLFLAKMKNVNRRQARKEIMEWLTEFGLESYATAKVEELSKGMAQKVQFIGSIIHRPRLIILDEPFSGLDPVSQDMFKEEIRRLAENGACVLLSSHQMNIVEELCDRILFIHQGHEVSCGTVQEIKEKHGSYQVQIWGEEIDNILSMPAVKSFIQPSPSRWMIRLQEDIKPEVFLSHIPGDTTIHELSISRMSLHDIFVKIAKGGVEDGTYVDHRPVGDHEELA